MSTQKFSSAGFVQKSEKVKHIKDQIMPDTLVAEALEPFPGYHGENIPEQLEPEYIFLFLGRPYSMEDVIRATTRIKKYCDAPFEAHYSVMRLFNNEYYYAIRLRRMKEYVHIRNIQECFLDEGFQFHKARKLDTTGLLKVYKFMDLETEMEGVYRDINETCIHYLEMPGYMNWKLFVELTRQVKNNVDVINFDAALAAMYNFQSLKEFVRIYCFREHREKLEQLRKTYLKYYDYMKKIL